MVWFNRIKGFYDEGYWTKEMVARGVVCLKITEVQYTEITGFTY